MLEDEDEDDEDENGGEERSWFIVELDDDLIIRYTKQGDMLPLTTF